MDNLPSLRVSLFERASLLWRDKGDNYWGAYPLIYED